MSNPKNHLSADHNTLIRGPGIEVKMEAGGLGQVGKKKAKKYCGLGGGVDENFLD